MRLILKVASLTSMHAQPINLSFADSSVPERSASAEEAILKLTDTLRLLETERDEAVKTGERITPCQEQNLLNHVALCFVVHLVCTGCRNDHQPVSQLQMLAAI